MRLQIVLHVKTSASLPRRQGWIPLRHPAHPASSALLLFSVPQFPLTEPTRELLAAQPWLPWALMVPCPLWAELDTSQLAREPEAARALLVSAQPRPGFGNWPVSSTMSALNPSSKFRIQPRLSHQSLSVELRQPVQIKTFTSLNTVSEASNIIVPLSNIYCTHIIGQVLF